MKAHVTTNKLGMVTRENPLSGGGGGGIFSNHEEETYTY